MSGLEIEHRWESMHYSYLSRWKIYKRKGLY